MGLKFSLLAADGRLTLPARGVGGDWIVKTPDPRFAQLPVNELSMMRMAAAVGIDVPTVAAVHRDELPELPAVTWPRGEDVAFAIERFDRTRAGPHRGPVPGARLLSR